jgi:hypothetical protein
MNIKHRVSHVDDALPIIDRELRYSRTTSLTIEPDEGGFVITTVPAPRLWWTQEMIDAVNAEADRLLPKLQPKPEIGVDLASGPDMTAVYMVPAQPAVPYSGPLVWGSAAQPAEPVTWLRANRLSGGFDVVSEQAQHAFAVYTRPFATEEWKAELLRRIDAYAQEARDYGFVSIGVSGDWPNSAARADIDKHLELL